MENFIVSARKYRPITFSTVVGQASITNTLKNAVVNKHIAHAYLFCGPRGVGKTTCARIFAKTINCKQLSEDFEPCNVCESCLSFNESRSYNIHELDAASNNSVDDIRNLIDVVRIPPQIGKYSIYIIDEVHMLSQAAFNAFLKTLEEPPAHAIFILATTEKYKILPTILSRCQIFDFNRISVEDIAKHLENVASKENVEAEYEGLHMIAQKADGALRDALSIFDQIVSFSGNKFTFKDVINNLNILDYDYYRNLTTAFINNDITKSLLTFDEILNEGFDAQNFISGLSDFIRDLIVCKSANTIKLLNVAPSLQEIYKNQASFFSLEILYHLLNISNQCDFNYKQANNKRLHVELALIKMCRISNNQSNEAPEYVKVSEQKVEYSQNQAPTKKAEESKAVVEKKAESEIKPVEKVQKQESKTSEDLKVKQIKQEDVSISIKSMISETKNKNTEIISDEQGEKVDEIITEFTNEELHTSWFEFAKKYEVDEARLYNILSNSDFELSENYIVNLKLTNKLQEEIVNSIRTELILSLRNSLKNSKIDLKTIIEENPEENKKIIYSDSDKYKHLAEINPDINNLRDQLKLDFK